MYIILGFIGIFVVVSFWIYCINVVVCGVQEFVELVGEVVNFLCKMCFRSKIGKKVIDVLEDLCEVVVVVLVGYMLEIGDVFLDKCDQLVVMFGECFEVLCIIGEEMVVQVFWIYVDIVNFDLVINKMIDLVGKSVGVDVLCDLDRMFDVVMLVENWDVSQKVFFLKVCNCLVLYFCEQVLFFLLDEEICMLLNIFIWLEVEVYLECCKGIIIFIGLFEQYGFNGLVGIDVICFEVIVYEVGQEFGFFVGLIFNVGIVQYYLVFLGLMMLCFLIMIVVMNDWIVLLV